MKKKTKNKQDATLRNVRAAKKRESKLEKRIKKIEERLERVYKIIEVHLQYDHA